MKPTPDSPAQKAIDAGAKAAKEGLTHRDNPYTLRKFAGLSAWWLRGFNNTHT